LELVFGFCGGSCAHHEKPFDLVKMDEGLPSGWHPMWSACCLLFQQAG